MFQVQVSKQAREEGKEEGKKELFRSFFQRGLSGSGLSTLHVSELQRTRVEIYVGSCIFL